MKSSKKWTAFPKEYADQIHTVFTENFSARWGDCRLIIEGRIYPEEVALRVGILPKGALRQQNFEASMDYKPGEQEALASIHLCVDATASMLTDYLDNEGEVDFPTHWKPYPFQGKTIYLQTSTLNSELEAAADALLAAEGDPAGMVHESSEDEETASEDLTTPSLFTGAGKRRTKKPSRDDLH